MRTGLTCFDHLARLTDGTGLFEHAEITEPRTEHGYCVDDVARGLVVTTREPRPDLLTRALSMTYLRFVVAAQVADGRFHNRRSVDRTWHDEPGLEDCWGRALWGLGSTVAHAPWLAQKAMAHFDLSVTRRSPWLRATTFAALGAAEVLRVRPGHQEARHLLRYAAAMIGSPGSDPGWLWPEPRLRYANAALAEVKLAAGSLLDEPRWVGDGLLMLTWLVDVETTDGHLSVTPVGGWARGERRPAFDQQPIEVAALADACALALDLTSDPLWADAVERCARWFEGANDAGVALVDPAHAGSCDGLERDGRNENQGAESTLAMLSTFQHADRLQRAAA
jgi:hypothetical protein